MNTEERPVFASVSQQDEPWNRRDRNKAGPFGPFCAAPTVWLLREQTDPAAPDARVLDLLIARVERTGPALAVVCGL